MIIFVRIPPNELRAHALATMNVSYLGVIKCLDVRNVDARARELERKLVRIGVHVDVVHPAHPIASSATDYVARCIFLASLIVSPDLSGSRFPARVVRHEDVGFEEVGEDSIQLRGDFGIPLEDAVELAH